MKKIIKQKPQNEQILELLKKLASRMEDAAIDISSMKTDLKFMKLRLTGVEHNTELMKVDIETLKLEVKEMKKEIEDIIRTNAEVFAKMVTQEELQSVSRRVASLETQ